MNIKHLTGLGPPKKIEKQSAEEVRSKKVQKEKATNSSHVNNSDLVQISDTGKELQQSNDEMVVAKELLSRLPTVRAHIIYEALAKIKAGLYSSEEIVEQAAEKLLESGEFDDLIDF
ncbi:MAG: hypothetical protein ACE5HI_04415 [bacterium]